MSCKPGHYPGKVFPDTVDEYWTYGIGAMCWVDREDGQLEFWLRVPVVGKTNRTELWRLYPAGHAHGEWTVPGPVNSWDGNRERPTFNGSLHMNDGKGWHGFIRNGDLWTHGA